MGEYNELVDHVINELSLNRTTKPLWISITCAVMTLEEIGDGINFVEPRRREILRRSLGNVTEIYGSYLDPDFMRRLSALKEWLAGSRRLHGKATSTKEGNDAVESLKTSQDLQASNLADTNKEDKDSDRAQAASTKQTEHNAQDMAIPGACAVEQDVHEVQPSLGSEQVVDEAVKEESVDTKAYNYQEKATNCNDETQMRTEKGINKCKRRRRAPRRGNSMGKDPEQLAAPARISKNKDIEEAEQRYMGSTNKEDPVHTKTTDGKELERQPVACVQTRAILQATTFPLEKGVKETEMPQNESSLDKRIEQVQLSRKSEVVAQKVSEAGGRSGQKRNGVRAEPTSGRPKEQLQWKKWISKSSGICELLDIERLLQMTNAECEEKGLQNTVYELPFEVTAVRYAESRDCLIRQNLIISAQLCAGVLTDSRDSLRFVECTTKVALLSRNISATSGWRQLTLIASAPVDLQRAIKFIRYILDFQLPLSYEEIVRICHRRWYTAIMDQMEKGTRNYQKTIQKKSTDHADTTCRSAKSPFMKDLDLKELLTIIGTGSPKSRTGAVGKKRNLGQYNVKSTLRASDYQSGAVMGKYGCTAAVIEHVTDTIVSLKRTHDGLATEVIIRAKHKDNLERAEAFVNLLMEEIIQMRDFCEELFGFFAEATSPTVEPAAKNMKENRQPNKSVQVLNVDDKKKKKKQV